MPAALTNQTVGKLRISLARQAGDSSDSIIDTLLGRVKSSLQSILNPKQEPRVAEDGSATTATTGFNPATARADLKDLAQSLGADQLAKSPGLNFALRVPIEVARGGGRYVAQNDPAVVDEYPAWELYRLYERKEPRLDHEVRWERACAAAGDSAAIAAYQATGRMVALKDSDVWQQLGDGAGGWDDGLGNPFPPFWFNSGMDVDNVPYDECVDLGLITDGQEVKPAVFNLADLFAAIEEAA